MGDQTKNIPTQRGTSSGEIGQNPVEIIRKDSASPKQKSSNDPEGDALEQGEATGDSAD